MFDKEYVIGIDMKNKESRCTPSISDLEKAEEILVNRYNQLRGRNVDVKKEFKHYVRQYFGMIDSSDNKNVMVQLIDNSRPGKVKRLLGKGWEGYFVIMLADSFYAIRDFFIINIDTGKMDQ